MQSFDPQSMMNEWVGKFYQPDAWQEWMKSAQQMNAAPLLEVLREAGGTIAPETLLTLQQDYAREAGQLWQDFVASKVPALSDRRFTSGAWKDQPMSAYSAAAYLLNARFLMALAEAVDASPKIRQKIIFAVQQMIDAMSPANFLATNPDAQAKLIETKGESLAKGITQMLADMQKGRISQTDESAFHVGQNVATTEGAVVFENRLFQLIQYKPLTDTVHQRPMLMIPPCINKFYILDLQPENSVVRYLVEQGHTVYLVSWANPDQTMDQVTWDDYIEEGAITAINTVKAISGQKQLSTFGFCVGGTILSTALAVLAARGEHPAASVTLLTTLLDFSNTGVLDVFVDEMQVTLREKTIGKKGLLPGRDLASTFSALRANDLVWNYVQANYLKGEAPPPFDLLYWNSDSTNLPGPMFCWYLRNTYLENKLCIPNGLSVCGETVDLGLIDAPVFIYGSREDHIVPWQAAFASMALLNPGKPERNVFVLGASGHIAGVVNPPAKKKRSYWVNHDQVRKADDWFAGAAEHAGSWWPVWADFLSQHAGKKVKVPVSAGNKDFPAIEPAPGRYVKVRAA